MRPEGRRNAGPISPSKYVRAGADGTDSGDDWTNAYPALPVTLTRGTTYWVADGEYPAYACNAAEDGTALVTIRKATAASHNIETGWDAAYGDGQAVFADTLTFSTGYWVFDGSGTHTVPSKTSSDYGFKVATTSTTATTGMLQIGGGFSAPHVTVRYTHVGCATSSADGNNGTVPVRWSGGSYTKLQCCFIENGGKDGLQLSSTNHILVERCYLKHLGMLQALDPDYHGQTVQMFWDCNDIIFRWNVWESCEGEGLISHSDSGTTSRIRFYGNVVFHPLSPPATVHGFNGGIFTKAADWEGVPSHWYCYHNTWVHLNDTYAATNNRFRNDGLTATEMLHYNSLIYDTEGFSSSGGWTVSHGASGGLGLVGGASEQVDLPSSIFVNYAADNFQLASATEGGLDCSAQGWWDDSADEFFGTLDSAQDMLGHTRAAWHRGAFEYVG